MDQQLYQGALIRMEAVKGQPESFFDSIWSNAKRLEYMALSML